MALAERPASSDSGSAAEVVVEALESTRYRASEVETIGRLLLRERPTRIVPGDWWAFAPEIDTLIYPARLLGEWSGTRIVGGLIHEVAEASYAGSGGVEGIAAFLGQAARHGIQNASALLLLNVVNDLRVNSRYLVDYPGADRFLRSLYGEAIDMHAKNDVRGRRSGADPLRHHLFLDALIGNWARTRWPEIRRPASPFDGQMPEVWPLLGPALAAEHLAGCAAAVAEILPRYGALVEASKRQLEEEARRAVPPELGSDEPLRPSPEDDSEDAFSPDGRASGAGEDEEASSKDGVLFFVREDAPIGVEDPGGPETEQGRRSGGSTDQSRTPRPFQANEFDSGPRWVAGVIQRIRRFRPRGGIDYTQFDYIQRVRELEPLIDAAVHGRGDGPGLAQILALRRFGTIDPFRRPRRFRRGDTGDIDEDRPENLLIDPGLAFLHRARQVRDDSVKDFANAILLDISGSVIQKGYPSRKFDQTVDTAVLFVEIHERLKLPYEVIAFSEAPRVLRSLTDTLGDSSRVAPASRYVVKDFSYLIREMYELEHAETREAIAIQAAIADIEGQIGLKTVLMVTDGISSDRVALVDVLTGIEERNSVRAVRDRLGLLAFGVGLAEGEFRASYEPHIEGAPISCASGLLVPNIDALPPLICQAIERRILGDG